MYDLAILGGRVVDPENRIDQVANVYLSQGRIAAVENAPPQPAGSVVDATGCLVTPGLVDCHCHIYQYGTQFGCGADATYLPMGTTCAIDAGSAGLDTFRGLQTRCLVLAEMRAFALVNVAPGGMPTERLPENLDPRFWNAADLKALVAEFAPWVRGLKIRISRRIVGTLGLAPLEAALDLAEQVGLPVVVHPCDPPGDASEAVGLLRRGDVYAHTYNNFGSHLLDEAGRVKKAFVKARERGVIFDHSAGRMNYSFQVMRAAFQEGFYPDTLSSDLLSVSRYGELAYGLPYIMSYYRAFGWDVPAIVKACTATPAKVYGLEGIGSLAVGNRADLAVFRLEDHEIATKDQFGATCRVREWFVPQLTLLGGQAVYRQVHFRTA